MGTGDHNVGLTLRWTSMPSKRSLCATETGIKRGLMDLLAHMQALPYLAGLVE